MFRNRFSREYIDEVSQFMKVTKCHVNRDGKTRCVCKFQNWMFQTLDELQQHLFAYRISYSYMTNEFIMDNRQI